MTAQALAGTCAGAASIDGCATRKVTNNPQGHVAAIQSSVAPMGKGSTAFATHSLWSTHTIPTTPSAVVTSVYLPPKTGQLWPRGRRNAGPS